MNFDFLDRRSAERFAELLDETSGSRRHHARGPADEELAELVAIGHSLSAARSGVQVDPEFRVGLRAMLVATAERDGIGATATDAETDAGGHDAVPQPRGGFFTSGLGRRIRARGVIVIGVAAGAMAVSGISAASENASPGDALYGVKRSTERAQLAMAGSDVTRGELALNFARTRLAEAATLPGDDDAFAGVLTDMDNDTRQGVQLLTSSAVSRRDPAPLTTVDTFVAGQGRMLEPLLGDLSTDNRKRAVESMTLLEDVQQRTRSLRAGLACESFTPTGTDALGPQLRACPSGANGATDDADTPQGQGQRIGSKPDTDPAGTAPRTTGEEGDATDAADPDATGTVRKPGATVDRSTPPTGPAAGGPAPADPATEQPEAPADEPADKGVLGGLLDGIFG